MKNMNDAPVADMNGVAANAALETDFGGNTKIEYVAYSRLCKSPHNVRTKTPTGIPGLADNIEAKGLLQNLVVHVMKGSRGKNPPLGVCAGQRRNAALDLLFESGRIAGDYPVPVKIVSEAEALAASLIENQQREPMHPADASVAFKLLQDEGRSIDYIAALFTTSPLAVRRSLKLANVSTKLLELFRNDEMTYEHVSALALTDDHEIQERLWFGATNSWQRNPSNLRAAITREEVDARNSALASFVTVPAYEAAGGYVRHDLFSAETDAVYLGDSELLQRMAAEKMVGIAQQLSAEGWSWVETRLKYDFNEIARYGRLPSVSRNYTKKEKMEFRALEKAKEAAQKALEDYYDAEGEGDDATLREQLERASEAADHAVDDFAARLESWDDTQKAHGGAFVTLDNNGNVQIERGLIKPQDRKTARRENVTGADEIEGGRPEKPLHGKELCKRLTSHRTAAVQVELARNPVAALAVLMTQLIPTVFDEQYGYLYDAHATTVRATCTHGKLAEVDDMDASPAWLEISAERKKWAAMLPKRFDQLLPWLLAQGEDVTSNLFAFCVAATVDGVSITDTPHPVNAIADMLELDVTKYWTPTRTSYLNHVPKSRIVDVVSAAVSPEAAAPLAAMKKDAAAEAAELRLTDSGWLPEVLTNRAKPHAYDSVDDEATEDAEDEAA
jgi:ParB family chromosome partitioning protein